MVGFVMGPEAMAQFLQKEGMTHGTNDDHDQGSIDDPLARLQSPADFSTNSTVSTTEGLCPRHVELCDLSLCQSANRL